jgi:hypothetical protein
MALQPKRCARTLAEHGLSLFLASLRHELLECLSLQALGLILADLACHGASPNTLWTPPRISQESHFSYF